jgi:DUF4097 and DUF4098 domain-containing protein YvlB
MDKITVATSSAPEVIIEQAYGNLTLRGWDREEVTATAQPNNLKLEEQNDVVRLSCNSDCTVRMPHDANLRIDAAHAAVRAKYLHDQITMGSVYGHLALKDVSGIQVETVHGNFSAKQVSGDVQVGKVNGNLTLRSVQGACQVELVNGNLDLRDVDGGIRTVANGNARLRLSKLLGSEYNIKADGNLHCRIPQEASAALKLTSRSESIRLRLPEGTQAIKERDCELTLGDGDVGIKLSAGGAVYFSAFESWEDGQEDETYAPLPEDFGDQIAEQVEAQIEMQMEMMNQQLNEQFERLSTTISSSGMTEEEMERIMEQWRVRSEQASEQTQAKMRRAQVKLERKLKAAKRKKEMQARAASRRGRKRRAWTVGVGTPSTPAQEPVSEEERLMILQMLEQKKITPDEAEHLLAALEGQA